MSDHSTKAMRRLLIFALILMGLSPPPAPASDPLVFAVIPSAPPVATHTLWAPLVERLAQDTGHNFRLKVYETMADFERDIVAPEAPDFIFANSLQIVVAHQLRGYIPLVRGGGVVWAEVFVRRDSPARTKEDLAGKRIAFVGGKNL